MKCLLKQLVFVSLFMLLASSSQAATGCSANINGNNQMNFPTPTILGIIDLPNNTLNYTCTNNSLLSVESYNICIRFNTPGNVPFAIVNGATTIPVTISFGGVPVSPGATVLNQQGLIALNTSINPLPTLFSAKIDASVSSIPSGTYTGNFTLQLNYRYSTGLIAPASCLTGGNGGSSATTNVTMGVTINKICTVSASNISFGTINTFTGASATSAGSIQTNCTANTAFTATLSSPNVVSNVFNMVGTYQGVARKIPYSFFQDVTLLQPWLPTTTVSKNSGITGSLATPVYARVLNTDYRGLIGTYQDTVTVQINY